MRKNETSPTMIIPNGTEIQIDVHGQLSVRTPGNLVIQNSGHYGEIESVEGSIRIDANAEVEAVSENGATKGYLCDLSDLKAVKTMNDEHSRMP